MTNSSSSAFPGETEDFDGNYYDGGNNNKEDVEVEVNIIVTGKTWRCLRKGAISPSKEVQEVSSTHRESFLQFEVI